MDSLRTLFTRISEGRRSLLNRLCLLSLLPCLCNAHAETGERLTLCIDFGCKHEQTVLIDGIALQGVEATLKKAATAEEERLAVGLAIGRIERLAGQRSPIRHDRARNARVGEPGQLDCIAESRNTRRILGLLMDRRLLRWHLPRERVRRAPWLFDIHWAASLQETRSGKYWVVDSWFRDNGEPAVVQSLSAWRKGEPFEQ